MSRHNSGFSLIELMVSLAILATVATLAIRAGNGLQSQTRYQTTTRSLDDIRGAIVGPANLRGPDGSVQVTGFVADIGRLPQFRISGSDPLGTSGDPLNELLQSNSLPLFSFQHATSDSGVTVGVGWKGPYMRLGAGPSYIRDGWGNSFHCYDGGGVVLNTNGSTISQIASWCADNLPDINHGGTADTSGYNGDVSVPNGNIVTSGGFVANGTLFGHVSMDIGTDASGMSGPTPNPTFTSPGPTPAYSSASVSIWVCYFGPKPDGTVAEVAVKVADNASWAAAVANGFQFSLSGSDVTIGPRVLRVYVLPNTTAAFNTAAVLSAYAMSAPMTVTVTGGSQSLPNIVLPHYLP